MISEHSAEETGQAKARLPRPGRKDRLACLLQSGLRGSPSSFFLQIPSSLVGMPNAGRPTRDY